MSETNQFDYDDLEPWTIKGVRVKGKEYEVREPTAGDGHKYRVCRARGAKLVDDGKNVLMGEPGETEILLVSLCTFDDRGANVPVGVVRGWHGRVVSELHDEIKRRSPWLDGVKRGDDGPKGSPGDSTGSSGLPANSDGP